MEIRVPFDQTQQALSSLCPRETDGWGLPPPTRIEQYQRGHGADGGGPALGGCDLPRPRWPGVRYPNLNYVHLCQQLADKEMKGGRLWPRQPGGLGPATGVGCPAVYLPGQLSGNTRTHIPVQIPE